MSSLAERLKNSFTNNFDQLVRVAPRNVAAGWNVQDASDNLVIAPANCNLISAFDRVRRFRCSPIQQNKTRVAKLLGNSAARAKAA